jgi:hypothetical protein
MPSVNLKRILPKKAISKYCKLLAILYFEKSSPKTIKGIKDIARNHGLSIGQEWGLLDTLRFLRDDEYAIRLPDLGYEITEEGEKVLIKEGLIAISAIEDKQLCLRQYAHEITSSRTEKFIVECIQALELGLLRAAVILSWSGAICILHEEVFKNHKDEFEAELIRRNPKTKSLKTLDDLSEVKEYDFLQIASSISLVGKNVKQELEQCLKLRNACAHPNSLEVGELRVSAHIEILVLNVYQQFC